VYSFEKKIQALRTILLLLSKSASLGWIAKRLDSCVSCPGTPGSEIAVLRSGQVIMFQF
jgi:hypothetical protein